MLLYGYALVLLFSQPLVLGLKVRQSLNTRPHIVDTEWETGTSKERFFEQKQCLCNLFKMSSRFCAVVSCLKMEMCF